MYLIKEKRSWLNPLIGGNQVSFSLKFSLNYYFIGDFKCVRWSRNGDMIASASEDNTVRLIDVGTEDVLWAKTLNEKESKFFPSKNKLYSSHLSSLFCLFHVNKMSYKEIGKREGIGHKHNVRIVRFFSIIFIIKYAKTIKFDRNRQILKTKNKSLSYYQLLILAYLML